MFLVSVLNQTWPYRNGDNYFYLNLKNTRTGGLKCVCVCVVVVVGGGTHLWPDSYDTNDAKSVFSARRLALSIAKSKSGETLLNTTDACEATCPHTHFHQRNWSCENLQSNQLAITYLLISI